jgi:hypothetical protein
MALVAWRGRGLAGAKGKRMTTKRNRPKWRYVVLANGKLEHREIAETLIGRPLDRNEIVHHINGVENDNDPKNLCVMDRDEHELFHAWLKWKKSKAKAYPPRAKQIQILTNKHQGICLEKLLIRYAVREFINGHAVRYSSICGKFEFFDSSRTLDIADLVIKIHKECEISDPNEIAIQVRAYCSDLDLFFTRCFSDWMNCVKFYDLDFAPEWSRFAKATNTPLPPKLRGSYGL